MYLRPPFRCVLEDLIPFHENYNPVTTLNTFSNVCTKHEVVNDEVVYKNNPFRKLPLCLSCTHSPNTKIGQAVLKCSSAYDWLASIDILYKQSKRLSSKYISQYQLERIKLQRDKFKLDCYNECVYDFISIRKQEYQRLDINQYSLAFLVTQLCEFESELINVFSDDDSSTTDENVTTIL